MKGKNLAAAVLLSCSVVSSASGQTATEGQTAGGAQRDPSARWEPSKGEPVPPKCAAFLGKWSGRWMNFGTSDYALWVKEVSPTCVATFAYYNTQSEPRNFRKGEIKDGKLSYLCDTARQGTCTFERRGDDMFASYSAAAGNWSEATFRKISTETQ